MRSISGSAALAAVALVLLATAGLEAHGVSGKDAVFLQALNGPAIGPLMYLGAKHMVTGYDHLLFLFGVIFFLYRMRDVAVYVTCFAVGHSITLLTGVLSGIHVNPFLVDALIGLSVVYKAFDNLDGFKTMFGFQPNTKLTVLGFGLIHGFGLATKLQEFNLSPDGLVPNMISFNVGVELGQHGKRMLVDGKPVCVIVPSDREVSMKKLAAGFGGKSAQMMKPADAERLSGYKVGGISPFGQMKAVLHRHAPGVPVVDLFADAPVFDAEGGENLIRGGSLILTGLVNEEGPAHARPPRSRVRAGIGRGSWTAARIRPSASR